MCGIAGIIREVESEESLKWMLNATIHRGPDNTGMMNWESLYMGMNRLSIIDTSSSGNQPLFSDDGRYAMVYNGEVYNFKEYREKLKSVGFNFNSETDSEVVFKSIIHFGVKVVSGFRGMFAIAFLDKQQRKLFLIRDHFGIKPVYYYKENNTIVFCSEIKGMLASKLIQPRLNTNSLDSFLYWGAPFSSETAIQNVIPLDPATIATIDITTKSISFEKYWSHQQIQNQRKFASYQEVVDCTRQTLLNSVKEQMVSDVPIGMFLSSGMDSNIIVACTQLLGMSNVNTISIGFETENNEIDERTLAQASADYFKTKHYSRIVTAKEVAENFDDFVEGLDQFSMDGLNSYWVSKVAKENVTVSLSGLGADEYFGGYLGFRNILSHKDWNLPYNVLNTLENGINELPKLIRERIRPRLSNLNDLAQFSFMMNKAEASNLMNAQFRRKDHISSFRNYMLSQEIPCDDRSNRLKQYYIFRHMTSQLLRDTDAVSMKHSLEIRVPFLDTRLAEISFSLPEDYLMNRNVSSTYDRSYGSDGLKQILGDAFKDAMPPEFFNRKKTGFQLPFNNWMRKGLRNHIFDELHKKNDYLNHKEVERELKQWDSGANNWKKIYMLFVFQSWFNRNGIN